LSGPGAGDVAPLWVSGFRPFFLAAAAYGPLCLLGWLAVRSAGWPAYAPGVLWHAHEMLFGFAAALVCGVLLTALPSWSGAREMRGARLALLAALWLAGRLAMLAADALPRALVAVIDCALLPALCLMLLRAVAHARRRLFWWTLPPLAAFAAANVAFHVALAQRETGQAAWALTLGVHALAFLFTLYGGLFIGAFTRRYLHERGRRAVAILLPLEYATAAAMAGFAAADLCGAPPAWMLAAALAAAAVHAWRFARWQGWLVTREPLLWSIHLGYAWLILALLLRGLAELAPQVARDAWIHAFTLGAYGLLKIGLMNRVVLRHTGRPVRSPPAMQIAFVAVFAAAVLRLAWAVHAVGETALVASAVLWSAAFATWLALYGAMLFRPSLPR
jgi:uncharacterized protein involved in response to NO